MNQLDFKNMRITIIGAGPGGYEAASVASQLGAKVTIIENKDIGGSAVLTDVVPSKSLIATADAITNINESENLGIKNPQNNNPTKIDLQNINKRLIKLAHNQSQDIAKNLHKNGVNIIKGQAKILSKNQTEITTTNTKTQITSEAILIAVGAKPKQLPTAKPDGKRILNWTQLYTLKELPQKLIVVGSGVTGAEFACAYNELGSEVALISSREQLLPGEDSDAAKVLEEVFTRKGMQVLSKTRAKNVTTTNEQVTVELENGQKIVGTHCLIAVGSTPNTNNLGLEKLNIECDKNGYIKVDKVSRTSVAGIYAAGDCTAVMPLASVAAMQGRIAVNHILGDEVIPLSLKEVSANIFTAPEIASVGCTQEEIDNGSITANIYKIPLCENPRAKIMGIKDGFIKIFSLKLSAIVVGGVVVGPKASELIFPIALAVTNRLTVDDLAHTFTVYPSLSGSISEAARRLHQRR